MDAMASDELVARIDRHMERGNELAARNLESFERNSEVLDRAITAFDDQREFMRELTVRSERSHASLMAQMQQGFDTLLSEMHRGFAGLHEEFADQRRAFVAILDRLPPAPS